MRHLIGPLLTQKGQKTMIQDYKRQIYAGVLGKVIGVYMGRPFEGWRKNRIQETLGLVDRYVAGELNKPLVVADDDISGTLTFIRAIEDSGALTDTPDDFFGDTWLNYLLENQTILWWGGFGLSTEHTAYLRLKQGYKSPESGSIKLNGAKVAEQIGAQIFIDAFGLACPGNPKLAAKLARKAAAVSHDGEAINAAVVVATMVAAAFTEKNMDKLLDIALTFIPENCLIAQIHKNVRAWCKQDNDWEKTWQRITDEYGYHIYGGNCHVVPNHAIMVMAWCYAHNNFRRAQAIVNTAGYDTDCNAANVGSVMGILVGLDAICNDYDFRTPIADRILLPSADGTNSTTDCWNEARRIIRLAEAIETHTPLNVNDAHWFDFGMPGAVHGFMLDQPGNNDATLLNPKGEALVVTGRNLKSAPATATTQILPEENKNSGYNLVGTPKLYAGMTVAASIAAPKAVKTSLFVEIADADATKRIAGTPIQGDGCASITIPPTGNAPVINLGITIEADDDDLHELSIQYVDVSGNAQLETTVLPFANGHCPGWIVAADHVMGSFSDDPEPLRRLISDGDPAFAVTGNRWWHNPTVQARVNPHVAQQAGIIACYQGTQRYISLTRRQDKLVLALQYYGETILAETPCDWPLDTTRTLKLNCDQGTATAFIDDTPVMTAQNLPLANGAVGAYLQLGNVGFANITAAANIRFTL